MRDDGRVYYHPDQYRGGSSRRDDRGMRVGRDADWLFDKQRDVKLGFDSEYAYDAPVMRLDKDADLDWFSVRGRRVA